MRLIGEGYSVMQIKVDLARLYKVTESAIEKSYYKLLKEIHTTSVEQKEAFRAHLMARNELIYREAMKEKRYGTALEANMQQAKLCGLMEKEKEERQKLPDIIEVSERLPDEPKQLSGASDDSN